MADVNPYAPPMADLSHRSEYEPSRGRFERFSIDAVMRRTWWCYRERMGLCIAVVSAAIVALSALSGGGDALARSFLENHQPRADRAAVGLMAVALMFYLQTSLIVGQSIVLLRVARGEPTRFTDLFRGRKYVLRVLAGSLLLYLATAGLVILAVALVLVADTILQALVVQAIFVHLGLALIFLVALFFSLPYFVVRMLLLPFVVIDRDCGTIEGLRLAGKLAHRRYPELFGIMTLSTAISLAGIPACGVGLVFTIPYGFLIYACAYVLLAGATPENPREIVFIEVEHGVNEVLDAGPEPRSDEFLPPLDLPPTELPP